MRSILIACYLVGFQVSTSVAQTSSVTRTSDSPELQAHLVEELLQQCKADLDISVEALQNVNIRFNVEVSYLVPDLPRVTGENGDISLNDGRMHYRFERTFPPLPNRPHVVELEEVAYDGHIYYLGKNSKDSIPSIKTFLGDNPQSAYAWQHYTKQCLYLEAAGYRLPRKVAEWKEGSLTSIVLDYLLDGTVTGGSIGVGDDSLIAINLTIPEPGVLDAQKKNLDLLIVQMKQSGSDRAEIEEQIDAIKQLKSSGKRRRVDLWLDPEKKHAVVRRVESTLDGKLIYEIKASDFDQFGEGGIWLPNKCEIKTFVKDIWLLKGFTIEPDRTDSIQLESVSFKPRDDLSFVLDYGPGTTISDRSSAASRATQSGKIDYVKPAPMDQIRGAAKAKQGRWSWLLIVNLSLFVLLAIGVAIRRFARK